MYISCRPTSLVRDLEVFLENGYEVVRVGAVDQFPFTANIETMALIVKRSENASQDGCTKSEKAEKNVHYREEEIPDCGCIYG